MSYRERLSLYQRIEEIRGKHLISYVTSLRPNATGQMAPDVVPEFARQVLAIPADEKHVDLLIVSNGGDPTVAWRCISFLRERFETIDVLLPYTAYSAATLLAMGANNIIMHPFANLGPVDPQITSTRPGEGKPQVNRFGSEDLVNYLAFVREDVGITDQAELQKTFELLANDVGAITVGAAKRSAQLSLSLGEKLLNLHMNDRNEAHAIAESLSKSFYHHGYPVGRSEARQIGLPVEDPNGEIESLLWDVWLDFEKEMDCKTPFIPIELIFADSAIASQLEPIRQVQLPSNLPPQLAQQAFNKILNQIQIVTIHPVNYELFHASVESKYCRSEFKTKGIINASRLPDMNIAVSVTPISQKWTFSENSDKVMDTE